MEDNAEHSESDVVFKILRNYYASEVAPKLTLNDASVTRGNSLKLLNQSFHYDLRKYSSPARVVNIWNNLPNVVVLASFLDTLHLKTDLIGSGVIKMLNMITLLN